MTIGSSLPKNGAQAELNKWYFGIQFLKCPPSQWKIFRPYIFVYCVKFLSFGDPYVLGGKKKDQIGGWKSWSCPFGISIEITRY